MTKYGLRKGTMMTITDEHPLPSSMRRET